MFKKVMVPLDGSILAEHALNPALALVQSEHSTLLLLRVPVFKELAVASLPGYDWLPPTDEVMARPRQEARSYLQDFTYARPYEDLALQTMVVDGDVASVIVDTARQQGVDLIVMTTHGRSGLTRWTLGSVTERVLQQAPCPVLATRPNHSITRVLFPLDGSRLAEASLAPGLAIARLMGAEATLLHVLAPEGLSLPGLNRLADPDAAPSRRAVRQDPEAYLADVAARFGGTDQAFKRVVREGPAGQRILDYAADHHIDLVAMATHGYTGVRRWLYGSTTEKVMRGSDKGMLIVRPFAASDDT